LIGKIATVGRWISQIGGTLLLAACATSNLVQPTPATLSDEQQYEKLFPYYAEVCALSRIGKKPGFGAEITSGFGGHAVLYLNHVCRKQSDAYPVLGMCDEEPGNPADGTGLSVNAHYASAAWVAIEGREFFFDGNLKPGQSLTREGYRALQEQAKAKKIYDAVDFHEGVYESMPASFSHTDAKYEISVATDYAIAFGRNRYCARVPVDRPQMVKIVDYLNGLNKPYKDGQKIFDWNLLTHNCSHVNHNALAAAGIWDEWEMDRFLLVSLFDFPVPKNEFVNLMQRTNDLPIDDPEAIYDDPEARELLLQYGRLPTQPGAIADLGTIASPNEVYDTQSRIIFYDDPITGRYERRFDTMLSDPRYFRLQDNLAHFAALYQKIERERKPLDWYLRKRGMTSGPDSDAFRIFYQKYYDYIGEQVQEVSHQTALLNGRAG
jgi:hypothetical protein